MVNTIFTRILPFKNKLITVLLGCIFILALVLRGLPTFTSDVWLDEASVYTLASGYDARQLLFMGHWDVAHPPLLYLFVHAALWLNNFNFIPMVYLRIPVFIFSALAVFPLYAFVQKLAASKRALWIALLYAIHPYHILQGYSLRPYGILQFLFPLAFFAFFESSWNAKWKVVTFNLLFIFLFYWDYASVWFFACFYLIHFIKLGFSTKMAHVFMRTSPFLISVLLWLPIFINRLNDAFQLTEMIPPDFQASILYLVGIFSEYRQTRLETCAFIAAILLLGSNIFINRRFFKKYFFIVVGSILISIPVLFSLLGYQIFIFHNFLFFSFMFLLSFISLVGNRKIELIYIFFVTVIFIHTFVILHNRQYLRHPSLGIEGGIFSLIPKNRNVNLYYLSGELDYEFRYALLTQGYMLKKNEKNAYVRANGAQLQVLEVEEATQLVADSSKNTKSNFFIHSKMLSDEEYEKLQAVCVIDRKSTVEKSTSFQNKYVLSACF